MAAAPNLSPPPVSQVINSSQLPTCETAVTPNIINAAKLGYVGNGNVGITLLGSVFEVVPTIPCVKQSNGLVSVGMVANPIQGPLYGGGKYAFTIGCYGSTGEITQYTHTSSESNFAGTVQQTFYHETQQPCARVASIQMTLEYVQPKPGGGYEYVPVAVFKWLPNLWRSDSGGWVPETDPNNFFEDAVELPIVCLVNNTGDDVFQLIGNTVSSVFTEWFPCMFIPQGWDRADKIGGAWSEGPAGQLVAAYESAVPNGIVCGSVVSFDFFGHTTGLNTCDVDMAPGFIKVGVGAVLILGCSVVIIRRIMWSVGSKG